MKKISMKKTISLMLGALVLMSSAGCSLIPDGTVNEVEDGKSTILQEVDGHIEGQLVEAVHVDADVIHNEGVHWKEIEASGMDYSKEEAERDIACFNFNSVEETIEVIEGDDGNTRYYCDYADGSQYMGVSFKKQYYSDVEYVNEREYEVIFQDIFRNKVNLHEALPVKELENCPLEEAITQVRTLCDKIDVSLAESEPEVFAMDAEHMTLLGEQYETVGTRVDYSYQGEGVQKRKISWTEEDEAYYMEFSMAMDGVPLAQDGFSTETVYAAEAKVKVVVGRDGIIYFNADRLYDQTSEKELEGQLCEATEALDIIAASYQYNTKESFEINRIELVYVPVEDSGFGEINKNTKYTVRPYWAFTMKVTIPTAEETYIQTLTTVVDAVTKIVYRGI